MSKERSNNRLVRTRVSDVPSFQGGARAAHPKRSNVCFLPIE
jgi:hypothetical protein